jgi:uncharacterized protein (TIGR00299 family) protein
VRLWLNPVSGISGDMLLGALLDLGAPLDRVRHAITRTGLRGWSLDTREVRRCGLCATQAVVTVTDTVSERRARELFDIVAQAPRGVRELAGDAILRLAQVEARLHGTSVDEVHLHELGGTDTVVDLVGVAAALQSLEITDVACAPVRLGHGTVRCAHGELPVPTPATLQLLAGFPVSGLDVDAETVTPTGAALLAALAPEFRALPPLSLVGTGYGAGSRELPHRPNVLPAVLGAPAEAENDNNWVTETLIVMETTLDDVSGEIVATAADQLRQAGALDVLITPAFGKKGRPAQVISALTRPQDRDAAIAILARETGTLGVRWHQVLRNAAPRTTTTVEVGGQRVDVKVGPHGAKPEYEHVRAAAHAVDRPAAEVAAAALAAWRGTAEEEMHCDGDSV